MKLTASMMLTLDGVYQGPGGPDEDRRGGFERGGWTAAYADEEMWPFLTSWFERADALLLGRKTWEIWEPYWPHHDSGDPVSHGINVLPKYVPSTTLKDPTWQNTHVIDGDVEAAIRELKAKPGRELQLHGSGVLLRWLLERDLVDELNLRVYPVIVGTGSGSSRSRARRTTWSWSTRVDVDGRDGSRPIDPPVARPSATPGRSHQREEGRGSPPRSDVVERLHPADDGPRDWRTWSASTGHEPVSYETGEPGRRYWRDARAYRTAATLRASGRATEPAAARFVITDRGARPGEFHPPNIDRGCRVGSGAPT